MLRGIIEPFAAKQMASQISVGNLSLFVKYA